MSSQLTSELLAYHAFVKSTLSKGGSIDKDATTARKVARKIYGECKRYARNPLMGESRDDLLPDIRLFTVRPYVVFYYPQQDGIRVARIIHGARDYPALFSE
jgi:plasmid stabilization system protein ParE